MGKFSSNMPLSVSPSSGGSSAGVTTTEAVSEVGAMGPPAVATAEPEPAPTAQTGPVTYVAADAGQAAAFSYKPGHLTFRQVPASAERSLLELVPDLVNGHQSGLLLQLQPGDNTAIYSCPLSSEKLPDVVAFFKLFCCCVSSCSSGEVLVAVAEPTEHNWCLGYQLSAPSALG